MGQKTVPAWALPPVTVPLGGVPALALSLLLQHSLPFLKHVSTEAPYIHLVGPVLGCSGSTFSGSEPAVSSKGQSLTSSCTEKTSNDALKHVTVLSVTHFYHLSPSGVTFTVLENYLLSSPAQFAESSL